MSLVGHRFGDWKVLERAGVRRYASCTQVVYRCRCVCGVIAEVTDVNLWQGGSSRCRSCAAYLRWKRHRAARAA